MKLVKLFLFNTPSWVCLLLLYYVWGEIKALKEKIVQFKKTIITPAILILLLTHTLMSIPNLDTLIVFLCVMSIFTGIIISYLIIVTRDSMFDDNNQLKIPYSKITFFYVITMFISNNIKKGDFRIRNFYDVITMFISKYYFQYIIIVDKKILNNSLFEELYVLGFSILTGLLIGKSIGYFHNIKKSKKAQQVKFNETRPKVE